MHDFELKHNNREHANGFKNGNTESVCETLTSITVNIVFIKLNC